MILKYKEFYNSLNNVFELNELDSLNETMSISMDVRDETRNVVKYINDEYKRGNMVIVDKKDFGKYSCETMKLKNSADIDIYGCKCKINLLFFNFIGDVSEDMKNDSCNVSIEIIVDYNNSIAKVHFILSGGIYLYNGKLTDKSESILSHELRHAYTATKIYDGVEKMTVEEKRKRSLKWREIYRQSTDFMKSYNKNVFVKTFESKVFYKMMYSIYACDDFEIDAFTQQAYEECRNCNDKIALYNKFRNTDLYRIMKSFECVIKLLSDDEIREIYTRKKGEYGFDKLPEIDRFIGLIEKKGRRVNKNCGRVLTLISDEIDGIYGCEVVDVR